jgi:predicted dehydrogenase
MARERLRWGIVGTGGIAAAFAADLALGEHGEVVAVGSRTAAGADAFADRFAIPRRHAGYDALVADPGVDAVYVATPHPLHRDNALSAIAAGKHVLVEKPFAMNAAQAREIAAAARAAGVFAMEAMWTRFLPHMVEIRRLLAAGALGELVAVEADHGQWFDRDAAHRLFARELGGGALLDLGVYVVSLASMVLGTPDRVVALVDPAFTGVDATASMLLGHPGGAQAILTCTSSADGPTRAAIVGTDARIEIDRRWYAPTGFTLIPREGAPTRWEQPHEGNGLRHEAEEVARCVASGRTESDVMPLDETIVIAETMDAVLAAGAR